MPTSFWRFRYALWRFLLNQDKSKAFIYTRDTQLPIIASSSLHSFILVSDREVGETTFKPRRRSKAPLRGDGEGTFDSGSWDNECWDPFGSSSPQLLFEGELSSATTQPTASHVYQDLDHMSSFGSERYPFDNATFADAAPTTPDPNPLYILNPSIYHLEEATPRRKRGRPRKNPPRVGSNRRGRPTGRRDSYVRLEKGIKATMSKVDIQNEIHRRRLSSHSSDMMDKVETKLKAGVLRNSQRDEPCRLEPEVGTVDIQPGQFESRFGSPGKVLERQLPSTWSRTRSCLLSDAQLQVPIDSTKSSLDWTATQTYPSMDRLPLTV